MFARQCKRCAKPFETRYWRKVYCERACQGKARTTMPKLKPTNCEHCGKALERKPDAVKDRPKRYCGRPCRIKAWKKRMGYVYKDGTEYDYAGEIEVSDLEASPRRLRLVQFMARFNPALEDFRPVAPVTHLSPPRAGK